MKRKATIFNLFTIMAATRVITAAAAATQTTSCFLAKRAFVLPAKKSSGGFGALCFSRRALVLKSKRPFSCSAIYNPQVKVNEEGQPETLDYRVFFLDGSGKKVLSFCFVSDFSVLCLSVFKIKAWFTGKVLRKWINSEFLEYSVVRLVTDHSEEIFFEIV